MTDAARSRGSDGGYPPWLPPDLQIYLDHTEAGRSIRSLARERGCHPSTVLRQIRRHELRRDDPLLDTALVRLAAARRQPGRQSHEETCDMNAQPRTPKKSLPDEDRINAEARRILRRLAEPDAVMAISPGMDKAVVVRDPPDGRPVRTAVLDRAVAEAFAVKDWISGRTKGRISRYYLTQAGRAALKRLLAEAEATRQGFSEAPAVFAEQHRDWGERELCQGDAKPSRRVRYNVLESPVAALARRRGRDGTPFLSDELVAAGERLREDFELAQMGPRVAQNWDRFLTGGARGDFAAGGGGGPESARDRVAAALRDLGPGLGDVALRCCCFLEGMEQAEKRMGWSARSGKIVLKIALQRLWRHYEQAGEKSGLIG